MSREKQRGGLFLLNRRNKGVLLVEGTLLLGLEPLVDALLMKVMIAGKSSDHVVEDHVIKTNATRMRPTLLLRHL